MEAVTYRFRGHSMADPVFYRTKAEEEAWRAKDPIILFQKKLEAEGLLTREEFERLEREVEQAIQEAVRFAEESPEPSLGALYEDIYAQS